MILLAPFPRQILAMCGRSPAQPALCSQLCSLYNTLPNVPLQASADGITESSSLHCPVQSVNHMTSLTPGQKELWERLIIWCIVCTWTFSANMTNADPGGQHPDLTTSR
ncbi:hypothetical protein SKAU_G00188710 [Synaphobranchus kaupii]|uniref:Uncharacterized protein n=1 Tax=Synaphobranchus kaupii TaxID=118154 RepID=A0A9Q1IUZ6_SYNKA|nr:hypothetical protein SKAU_G00188710 [Synaphobranchus kaupii]